MTLFSDALDDLVLTDLGVEGLYKAGGTGAGTTVRVLLLARDMTADVQGFAARVDRQRLQVPASAVAAPKTGDTFTIAGKVWKVLGPPEGDARGISWQMDLGPA